MWESSSISCRQCAAINENIWNTVCTVHTEVWDWFPIKTSFNYISYLFYSGLTVYSWRSTPEILLKWLCGKISHLPPTWRSECACMCLCLQCACVYSHLYKHACRNTCEYMCVTTLGICAYIGQSSGLRIKDQFIPCLAAISHQIERTGSYIWQDAPFFKIHITLHCHKAIPRLAFCWRATSLSSGG